MDGPRPLGTAAMVSCAPEEQRAVLARARAIYLGDEEERRADLQPRVRPHADYVVAELAKLDDVRYLAALEPLAPPRSQA